ncbi:unnamed protein product [Acanthosepion pharaonis]|uniref:Leucine-rich repeat-containing protein 43 n=1 Tax=Acanthosepion pharaonis TaxID=158019 RepID=A0A812ETB7_ACAPH|nr:unnamed protein product [Sepia pharaonis]
MSVCFGAFQVSIATVFSNHKWRLSLVSSGVTFLLYSADNNNLQFEVYSTKQKRLCVGYFLKNKHKLLGNLGLQEFPCGTGTWREKPQIENKAGYVLCPEEISAISLKDYDVKYERVETLLEYATSPLSPWSTDCSWSNEAAKLRQIAITAPHKITENFICSYFKTLTIRNANTLELSGNNITDLAPLCAKPPPLVHLGLSYNRVDSISKHLTAQHWPQLLCLDLFHNNLCDVKDVGQTLKSLPKLQSLVLVGNPLSLTPGYRGFLIDCLPMLNILDDFTITADEIINYKSLHLHTDCIQNVAFIKVSIPNVKGLLDPQEQQLQTDVNIIQKSYFIQLLFIHEEANDSKQSNTPSVDQMIQSVNNLQMEPGKQVDTSVDKQLPGSLPNTVMTGSKNSASQNNHNRSFLPYTNEHPPPTTFLQSQDLPWAENQIDFNWNKVITCHNLLPLRDYLYQDLEFKIIECKLIGRLPVEEEEEEKSISFKGKGKDDKEAKKKKEEKGKKDANSLQHKTDTKSKNSQRKDKKNKISNENVIWSSPEFKDIATFYLNLEPFLHGEHSVEEKFIKEIYNTNLEGVSIKNLKKDTKGNKKTNSSSRAQSQAKARKSPEMKKGKQGSHSKGTNEDESSHLSALEMSVLVELEHWTSTYQALQASIS